MVRLGSAVPLLAAVFSAIASASVVPGAFIFEFQEGQNTAPALETLRKNGDVRMDLDFELFRGVSVQFHDVEKAGEVVDSLAAMSAIRRYWPVTLHRVPKAQLHWTGNPDVGNNLETRDNSTKRGILSAHAMTQIDKLHAKGYTGKGIHIAVIDSGIDYKHPSLGGCFGKDCLVTKGFDFVGDKYNGTNKPVPDNDPMDCHGHGTHVAGIIAANDQKFGFTGGAPGVTLGAYRVFGCAGTVTSDIVIAALNRAYADKANIITLSIGGPNGWKQNAWAVAASRIVARGVVITASAGNNGANGIFFASSGSSGEGVAAIASFDNEYTPTLVNYGNVTDKDGKPREFSYVLGNPDEFNTTLPLWLGALDAAADTHFCEPLPADTPDLSKYIVLIRRGNCKLNGKASNAASHGARHIIFYGNVDGYPSKISIKKSLKLHGVGSVDKQTGEAWAAQLRAGEKVILSLGSKRDTRFTLTTHKNSVSGGALSTFTAWGPTWNMDVKPQFGAPGGHILSTWPRAKGSYAVSSGTSMACPLAASIYALVAEARGTLEPTMIQNLLSVNAKPQFFHDGSHFYSQLAPVPQQGGGLIQAYDTAFATTQIYPSSLSFNESIHRIRTATIVIENNRRAWITYNVSYVSSPTVAAFQNHSRQIDPFPGDFLKHSAEITFNAKEFTVGLNDKALVRVSIKTPRVPPSRLPVWSGYIFINGSDGKSFSVPYQGLVGNLRKHYVLDQNATYICRNGDVEMKPLEANTVFTIPRPPNTDKANLPAIVFAPSLGSSRMQLHAVAVSKSGNIFTPLGQIKNSPVEYVSRAKDSMEWDGRLSNDVLVPEGRYQIVVKMLRLYGNEKKAEDWDESTTPPFGLKYAEE
ncbi:subtilisin-like protease [Metarhizium rileyi]|uniref:Subtilisin-like protease n=1 Tax=Metarhizium rileyi (strain RCEF 4871) TaxID=1649241 RepID=A0A166ZWV8_METRR|nr:subtilisin-like protease [Metarhizium rileyi RCEF 4871]